MHLDSTVYIFTAIFNGVASFVPSNHDWVQEIYFVQMSLMLDTDGNTIAIINVYYPSAMTGPFPSLGACIYLLLPETYSPH